jgi:hypothetical protein
MSLRKWLGKRRLIKHANYLRDLRVAALRKEVAQFGYLISETYGVTCAHCNSSECACDFSRNSVMRDHRIALRNIHADRHNLIEKHDRIIEDLEGRLNA